MPHEYVSLRSLILSLFSSLRIGEKVLSTWTMTDERHTCGCPAGSAQWFPFRIKVKALGKPLCTGQDFGLPFLIEGVNHHNGPLLCAVSWKQHQYWPDDRDSHRFVSPARTGTKSPQLLRRMPQIPLILFPLFNPWRSEIRLNHMGRFSIHLPCFAVGNGTRQGPQPSYKPLPSTALSVRGLR